MSLTKHDSERGDTLIEVLVALTVLAVVIVGSFSIMNKGVSAMYDNLERTEVRQLLDQQIEALNYARDQRLVQLGPQAGTMTTTDIAAATAWTTITNPAWAASLATTPGLEDCSAANAFYLTRAGADNHLVASKVFTNSSAPGFPGLGNGIWIQRISSGPTPVLFKDFYIKACWQPTSSAARQVLSSVVRLYDR